MPMPFLRVPHLALAAAFAMLLPAIAPASPFGQAPFGTEDEEVRVFAEPSVTRAAPGDQFAIAVVLDHAEGWHSHTNDPVLPPGLAATGFQAIPTRITVADAPGLKLGRIQWPGTKTIDVDFMFTGEPEPYEVFDGRAIAYLPVMVDPDAEGDELIVRLRVQYQACDDISCLPPEDLEKRISIPLVTLEERSELGVDPDDDVKALFAGFDPRAFERLASGEFGETDRRDPAALPEAIQFDVLGWFGFELNPRGPLGLAILLTVAAIGGFLLNLTPCVLPVVPLKIMGLSQAAGNRARCFYLGVVMSVGVVAFFVAIGAAIALLTGFRAISGLFAIPAFGIAVGLVIGIMGLGMLGLFTTGLPQWVYRIAPRHDTTSGSFLWGVMTAVLSTPCTAPLMGAAAAWATTQSAAVSLSVFGAIGAGMAMPYLVLSANPKWVDRIPRTGPASELIKQFMGLLLLAVAVYFLGSGLIALTYEHPYLAGVLHWWIIAVLLALASLWLLVRTVSITRKTGGRILAGAVALVITAGGLVSATALTNIGRFAYEQRVAAEGEDTDDGTYWVRFTRERFDAEIEAGNVVLLDFTAEWCINCKYLKATVLGREPVRSVLQQEGVVSMTVDLTSRRAPGWEFLEEELGQRAIPYLAIYGPGTDRPWGSNAYRAEQVIAAIEAARGPGNAGVASGEPGPAPSPVASRDELD